MKFLDHQKHHFFYLSVGIPLCVLNYISRCIFYSSTSVELKVIPHLPLHPPLLLTITKKVKSSPCTMYETIKPGTSYLVPNPGLVTMVTGTRDAVLNWRGQGEWPGPITIMQYCSKGGVINEYKT